MTPLTLSTFDFRPSPAHSLPPLPSPPCPSRIRPSERSVLTLQHEEMLKTRNTHAPSRRGGLGVVITSKQAKSLAARKDVCVLRDLLPLPQKKLYSAISRTHNNIHHDNTQWGKQRSGKSNAPPPMAGFRPTLYTKHGAVDSDMQKARSKHKDLESEMKRCYLTMDSTQAALDKLIYSAHPPGHLG